MFETCFRLESLVIESYDQKLSQILLSEVTRTLQRYHILVILLKMHVGRSPCSSRIFPDSWKTLRQVQSVEPLCCVV